MVISISFFLLLLLLLINNATSVLEREAIVNIEACSLLISKSLGFCNCALHISVNSYVLRCEDDNVEEFLNYTMLQNKKLIQPVTFFHTIYNSKRLSTIHKDSLKDFEVDITNYNRTFLTIGQNEDDFFYHLIFGNIIQIEDGAFETIKYYENLNKSNYAIDSLMTNEFNLNAQGVNLRLRVKFLNSNFTDMNRPFAGLKALKFEFLNLKNSYLMNSYFDRATIGSLYLKSCVNFIGFKGDALSGTLINSFQVSDSYNTEILSDSLLPAFINIDTFRLISITDCHRLIRIASFAFSRYTYLQELNLQSNSIQYIEEYAFENLTSLVKLDLSFNRNLEIIDNRFRDLKNLKHLYLTQTSIKSISENSLVGLAKLYEFHLSKTYKLEKIDEKAFNPCKKTLKLLNLAESKQKLLMKSIDYIIWLSGLSLNYLYIDQTYNISDIFAFDAQVSPLSCKIMTIINPRRTFITFNNQKCDCLKHWLYKAKPQWINNSDYRIPRCYRELRDSNQLHVLKCNYTRFENACLRSTTTTAVITSTVIITTTTTTTISTYITTTTTTRTPTRKQIIKPVPRKLDFKKLLLVLMTIILISLVAIVFTIVILKMQSKIEEKKKRKRFRKRQASRSSSQNIASIDSLSKFKTNILTSSQTKQSLEEVKTLSNKSKGDSTEIDSLI